MRTVDEYLEIATERVLNMHIPAKEEKVKKVEKVEKIKHCKRKRIKRGAVNAK